MCRRGQTSVGSAYKGKGRPSRGGMRRGACSHQRAGSPPCPGLLVGRGGGRGPSPASTAAGRPGGAGLPWEEAMSWGPNGFLLWEVVRGRVPALGPQGTCRVLSLGAAAPAVALPVGGACVEGGRAGRISSLRRWLPG